MEVTLSLERWIGVLQVEKRGKGILALCFTVKCSTPELYPKLICFKEANWEEKAINLGVEGATVNERRPRGGVSFIK